MVTRHRRVTKGSIAIDTVPLPERPLVAIGFPPLPKRPVYVRLETVILDQIRNRVDDERSDLITRFKLNVEAIKESAAVGYPLPDDSSPCFSDNPPEWCKYAGIIVTDGYILLVESLAANHLLDDRERENWMTVLQERPLFEVAPNLLRQIGMKRKSLGTNLIVEMLDTSIQASMGVLKPVPGSKWDIYCLKHPEDPLCWVIRHSFKTPLAQRLASEIVLISLLHQHKLINSEQVRLIYDTTFQAITAPRGVSDISLAAGIIITEGFVHDSKTRASILTSITRAKVSSIQLRDIPEECLKPNPPRWCWIISAFPVATELTVQLAKAKILEARDVVNLSRWIGNVLHGLAWR